MATRRVGLFGTSVLAIGLLAAGGTAAAHSDPSVDDLINSLRPTSSQLKGPTRGIRPALVASDETTDAVASTAGSPLVRRVSLTRRVARVDAPEAPALHASNLVVDFVSGSAELTPSAERTLNVLGKALTSPALSTSRFRIEGHTDTVGSAPANKDLSARRAEAVARYLQQKFAVEGNRLDPVGLGVEQLLVPTPDQTSEPLNRRVRLINLSG